MRNNTLTASQIEEMVKKHKCPGYYFCTVATTGYPEARRIEICTDCWNRDNLNEKEGV